MENPYHPFKDQTALHIVCNCGFSEIANYLLSNFDSLINIKAVNSKGSMPIHFASYGGHTTLLTALIKAAISNFKTSKVTGPTTEFFFGGQSTGIMLSKDNADYVSEFINIRTLDESQRTPLIIATEKGHADCVNFFLQLHSALKQFNPTLTNITSIATANGYLPIHKAASRKSIQIIEMLLSYDPETINSKTSKKKYPLYFAVKRSDSDVVRLMIKYGAATCEYTPSGKKLLHIAAFNKDFETCKLLVEQTDCDLNANTNDGHPRTALHLAAKRGHCDIIKLLLDKGANVECIDYFGRFPIHVAASAGRIEATELLGTVNGKNYINVKNATGISCLHFACASGHIKMISYLKEKGFNFEDAQDERNIRPIYVAAAQNQPEIVYELVKHYKKDINYVNTTTGFTPLQIAILRDCVSAVEALIKSGVDISKSDPDTLFALTKHKNNKQLVSMFNRILRSE